MYIQNGTVSTHNVTAGGAGELTGDASFVYRTLQHPGEKVPGGGGTFYKIDSTNFPASKTIAATFVTLAEGPEGTPLASECKCCLPLVSLHPPF